MLFQLLYIADVSKRAVHLPEHDLSKPGRQVVTFLLLCNIALWIVYTFEIRKVEANPVQVRRGSREIGWRGIGNYFGRITLIVNSGRVTVTFPRT